MPVVLCYVSNQSQHTCGFTIVTSVELIMIYVASNKFKTKTVVVKRTTVQQQKQNRFHYNEIWCSFEKGKNLVDEKTLLPLTSCCHIELVDAWTISLGVILITPLLSALVIPTQTLYIIPSKKRAIKNLITCLWCSFPVHCRMPRLPKPDQFSQKNHARSWCKRQPLWQYAWTWLVPFPRRRWK